MSRRVGTVVLIGVGAAVALLAFAWSVQRSMIYLPPPHPPPAADQVVAGAEDVSFVTDDGLRLQAWFVPAGVPGAPTVVVFHGNGGDRVTGVPLAEHLREAGMNVLLTDYRGYGGNPGSPSEEGLATDARAVISYLDSREDVDPRRLILFGESLGSGVAVRLAVERTPAALVLRSPFTSLVDTARHHFFFLPVGLLLRDRFPSIERIGAVRCPVMVIAGGADSIVPAELSRRLYEAAPDPKRLLIFPGYDHNQAALSDGDLWMEELAGFLREHGVL